MVSTCLFSRKLSSSQANYSTFGRELLAIYAAVKHFQYFIEGRQFAVYTDHKPLCYSLSSSSAHHSPREICHLAYISEFTTDIQHVSGANNPVADALSRIDAFTNPLNLPSIDFAKLALAQHNDADLQALRSSPSCSLKWTEVTLSASECPLICDLSTGIPRPYLPEGYRCTVFKLLHNQSHPGIRATRRLLSSKYVWQNMNRDVDLWTRSCLPCQRSKVFRHTTQPSAAFIPPDSRFSHIHIDLVGPLSESHGCKYLLTAVDRFTRWCEALRSNSQKHQTLLMPYYITGLVILEFHPLLLRIVVVNSSLHY